MKNLSILLSLLIFTISCGKNNPEATKQPILNDNIDQQIQAKTVLKSSLAELDHGADLMVEGISFPLDFDIVVDAQDEVVTLFDSSGEELITIREKSDKAQTSVSSLQTDQSFVAQKDGKELEINFDLNLNSLHEKDRKKKKLIVNALRNIMDDEEQRPQTASITETFGMYKLVVKSKSPFVHDSLSEKQRPMTIFEGAKLSLSKNLFYSNRAYIISDGKKYALGLSAPKMVRDALVYTLVVPNVPAGEYEVHLPIKLKEGHPTLKISLKETAETAETMSVVNSSITVDSREKYSLISFTTTFNKKIGAVSNPFLTMADNTLKCAKALASAKFSGSVEGKSYTATLVLKNQLAKECLNDKHGVNLDLKATSPSFEVVEFKNFLTL